MTLPLDEVLDRITVKQKIMQAMQDLYNIPKIKDSISQEHIENTPGRIAVTMIEMFEGCWKDPKEALQTSFTEEKYDQMIYVNSISFVSMCAHHNLPFFGKVYFAYLPDNRIVGLSKIPRLVEVYSRRPQVQEKLSCEIVDTFNEIVKPKGCGIVVEAIHLCMAIRGVENETAYSKTTALRGCFREGSTKAEFLQGITQTSKQIWP
jgi:GTP cyclohydrolase I